MLDPDRRDASLDLTAEEFGALLAGVTALAEQEVAAARFGRVFEHPPSAAEVDRVIDADRALPVDGESVEDLLAACAAVLAAGRRTTPAFFGYVQSPPAPVAVAADLLASAADQNLTSWRSGPAAAAVEHQTLRWIGELVGFDAAATGILVSGGSAANLTALLVALHAVTSADEDRRAMRVYASAETHFSVAKAAEALGVGLQPVAVDGERRLDPGALKMAIASDRDAGLLPICVVANAGTTSTGAIDPLDVGGGHRRGRPGVWLHVDGAYGAPAAADPASRHLFAGLHRADSLCIDAHKSAHAPVDCSALLLHDAAATARAFGAGADDYVRILATQPGGDLRLLGPRARAQPPLPGAQAVGDAALSRQAPARGGDRRGHPPRRPPRRSSRGRGGLRAPRRPRTEHLLLPAYAEARERARTRRTQRAHIARAAARRPRLSLQRDRRSALRPASLHYELPHYARRRGACAHGRT